MEPTPNYGQPVADGNLAKILCGVEILLSVLIFIAGIIWLVDITLSDLFETTVLALVIIAWSLCMGANAIGHKSVRRIQQYYTFYQTWLGKAMWLIFMGCLILIGKSNGYVLATGIMVLIYAFLALAAHWVCPFLPPKGLAGEDGYRPPLAEEPPSAVGGSVAPPNPQPMGV